MKKSGGKKMIPKWIKQRRKRRKQKDYAMRTFLVVAFFIIVLASTRNCADLINM